MEHKKQTKIVFEPEVARKLLKDGCQIIDIKPNKDDKKRTVFVFKNDENFKEHIASILQQRDEKRRSLKSV